MLSPYGSIQGLAVYTEHAINGDSTKNSTSGIRDKRVPCLKRPVGQTAIVGFNSTNSAIACKEELHWRPIAVDGSHNLDASLLEVDARERPLVNVQFQTSDMRMKVKDFVKRDFDLSWKKIRNWEKTYAETDVD